MLVKFVTFVDFFIGFLFAEFRLQKKSLCVNFPSLTVDECTCITICFSLTTQCKGGKDLKQIKRMKITLGLNNLLGFFIPNNSNYDS